MDDPNITGGVDIIADKKFVEAAKKANERCNEVYQRGGVVVAFTHAISAGGLFLTDMHYYTIIWRKP